MTGSASGLLRLRLRVVGSVQGVGFRYFVRSRARALEVAGWVRNEDDGSVLIVAEGRPEAMRRFRRAVAEGPRGSRVDHVVEEPVGEVSDLSSFEIRYY